MASSPSYCFLEWYHSSFKKEHEICQEKENHFRQFVSYFYVYSHITLSRTKKKKRISIIPKISRYVELASS